MKFASQAGLKVQYRVESVGARLSPQMYCGRF